MKKLTSKKKVLAATVAGLAVAGGGAAIAASQTDSPSLSFFDSVAKHLGISPEELEDATKAAAVDQVDQALEEGRITEEQADELKARIDADEFPLLGGPGMLGRGVHGGPGFGHFGHFGHFELLETAASYLGLTEAELREALEDKTLAEIAEEQGKTASGLVQELVATQTKRIDEAVADGRITEEQATELKAELSERMQELVNGELRARGDGERHRFWPGAGSPRAPPSFFGGPPA
jgi:polyhydroxyalkanoate synthesis regulator phasin